MKDKKLMAVSIRLEKELHEYLRVRAFYDRSSMSNYVGNLIKQDMEKRNAETAKQA